VDLLYDNFDEYISHLFRESGKIHKRNTTVCYYDCTNYYCEAETQDSEYVDEVTGEVMRGLRQFGFAKDHKPNPLVEMGLFMDTDGIPVSMCLAPGNTNEQTTAIPLEKELIKESMHFLLFHFLGSLINNLLHIVIHTLFEFSFAIRVFQSQLLAGVMP